jgi:hypothetical protein
MIRPSHTAITAIALRYDVEQHDSRRSVTAMAELAGVTTTRAAVSA